MNEAIMKFRDETTARLIEAIKSGTAPWQRPGMAVTERKTQYHIGCITG